MVVSSRLAPYGSHVLDNEFHTALGIIMHAYQGAVVLSLPSSSAAALLLNAMSAGLWL